MVALREEMPYEKVKLMFRTGLEYGKYPLDIDAINKKIKEQFMDEEKILEQLSLQGEERIKTLKQIHEVFASWGMKLLDVSPDPLNFGE